MEDGVSELRQEVEGEELLQSTDVFTDFGQRVLVFRSIRDAMGRPAHVAGGSGFSCFSK